MQATDVSVSAAARVPFLVERAPQRIVVIVLFVGCLRVGHVGGPPIRGILKNIADHGHIDSRRARRRCRNRLESRRQVFRSRPSGEAAVGLTVHSHAPVAPGLFGNPIDYRTCIVSVKLVRNDVMRTLVYPPGVSHDPDIAVRCALLGVVLSIINSELEQRGNGFGGVLRTNQHAGNMRPVRRVDEDVVVKRVAPMVVLGVERANQGAKIPISVEEKVRPDQFHRFRLSDAVCGALLIERLFQCISKPSRRNREPCRDRIGVPVIEARDRISERFRECVGKREPLCRLRGLGLRIQVEYRRAFDRPSGIRASPPIAQRLSRDIRGDIVAQSPFEARTNSRDSGRDRDLDKWEASARPNRA